MYETCKYPLLPFTSKQGVTFIEIGIFMLSKWNRDNINKLLEIISNKYSDMQPPKDAFGINIAY